MIHYHGGPITPMEAAREVWRRGHAMVSFAYPGQLPLAAEVAQSFVLDNGAFTAWKQARAVDWSEYVAWVDSWKQHPGFDWCLIPDSIEGDEEENDHLISWWANRSDAASVPVWHLHESLERLERLVSESQRVALGSSGEFAVVGTSRWWSRMSEAMEVACDGEGKPLAKLHGLRMLDPAVFSHLPLSSADSTNVAQNIGVDVKWSGPYQPMTKHMRAAVLADRIEFHASASRWTRSCGVQKNLDLVG
jgi:hypothetical protein